MKIKSIHNIKANCFIPFIDLIDKKISKSERDFVPIVELVFEDEKKENIILTVSDIKFSKFVKKIFKTDIKNFKNSNKILVIGRKKWQTEIKMT